MVPFAKKFKLEIDSFLHFFAKRRKLVEKMIYHEEKIGVNERPRSFNPGPIDCSCYYLERARCMTSCVNLIKLAVRMGRNN